MANSQFAFTVPTGGGFNFTPPGPSFLQSKYDDLQKKYGELETKLADTMYTLQKRIAAHDIAIAEKSSAVDDKEKAEGEVTLLKAAMEAQAEEAKESLSGDESSNESSNESVKSNSSNESAKPYIRQDGSTQTDEDTEAALSKKKMSEIIAELEQLLDETRKERNKLSTNRDNDLDYISRAEISQQEAEKAQKAAEALTAKYKIRIEELEKQEKQREEHIDATEKQLSELMDANEADKKEAQRIFDANKVIKEKLKASEDLVKWHKEEGNKLASQSSAVLRQEKKIEKENESQKTQIETLGDQIKESAHFAPDLFRHQAILENALAQINETIDEIPPLQLHPEAYDAPAGVPARNARLDAELTAHFNSSSSSDADAGENDQEDEQSEYISDVSDESSTSAPPEIEDDGEDDNTTIIADPIEIEQVVLQATIKRIEVEVPIVTEVLTEEGGAAPESILIPGPTVYVEGPTVYVPGPAPAPVIITQIQDRYFYFDRPIHSWFHVERDFTILLAALFASTFGTFFPCFVQEIRGVAPITSDPVAVRFDPNAQGPAVQTQAQMMTTSSTGTPGTAGSTPGAAPGSDPSDETFAAPSTPSTPIATPSLTNMFPPLPPSPDNREGIPPAPAATPKPAGTDSSAPVTNSGVPPPPPPVITAAPGFWNIFATRLRPGIWSTLLLLLLHLVVYYFVYISFSTYYERNLWLAANDATRAYLHSIMGLRYTNGILRKIVSESWARGIDRSLVRILTSIGLVQVRAFKMAG